MFGEVRGKQHDRVIPPDDDRQRGNLPVNTATGVYPGNLTRQGQGDCVIVDGGQLTRGHDACGGLSSLPWYLGICLPL